LKQCIRGQLSGELSVPPLPPSALTSFWLSRASPTEGGLSVHTHTHTHTHTQHHHHGPLAHLSVCFATTVLRVHSVSPCSPLPPSLPLHPSLSLMRRDRYGRGGRGGTCLSKPAVENEGSDEGGMLWILNAQTPVRAGGGGDGGSGWGYINRLLLKER